MEKMPHEADELSEAHWALLESFLRKTYNDAFVHGFKHGMEFEQKLRLKKE
jgi:hypothetical protein